MCALQSNHEKPTEILCNNTCRLHLWSTIIILDIILPCSNHAGMQFLIIHSQRNRFFALLLLNNTQHQIFIYSIHAIHFPLPSHCRVPPNSKPCCILSAHICRHNCSICVIHIYCDIALLPHFIHYYSFPAQYHHFAPTSTILQVIESHDQKTAREALSPLTE